MRPNRLLLSLATTLVATTLLGAQSRPAAPRDLIARAAQSIGGEAALRGVRTVHTRFTATTYGLGQEETWSSPARPSVVVGQSVVDHAGSRRALMQETRPAATPSGANVSRQVIAADYGVNEANGNWTPMGGAALAAAQRGMRQQPERLVLFALDNPSAVTAIAPKRWRDEEHDGVRIVQGADTLSLYFGRANGRPVLSVVLTDDPVLGDRATETLYQRWAPASGVMLPRQVDVTANGRPVSTMQVSSAEVTGSVDESLFGADGALIARARTAATNLAPPPIIAPLVSYGPGVWRVEGANHFTLVVEQGNGLLLVEAPLSAARMRAVFDTLASRFPGRAVTQVVNTHHHYDHSGGVREVMARGIPVVTHPRNVAFVNMVAAAPKTVAPDALSRGGRRPAVRAVADTMVIGSGASMVVLYPIPTVHVEGILAAYVPSVGVLFASDVLNPAATLNPVGAAELVAFAKARGLTVRTYAGGHGVAVPWADVERAAAR